MDKSQRERYITEQGIARQIVIRILLVLGFDGYAEGMLK